MGVDGSQQRLLLQLQPEEWAELWGGWANGDQVACHSRGDDSCVSYWVEGPLGIAEVHGHGPEENPDHGHGPGLWR